MVGTVAVIKKGTQALDNPGEQSKSTRHRFGHKACLVFAADLRQSVATLVDEGKNGLYKLQRDV